MKIIRKSILAVLVFTILCGIIYPVSTTVLAQVLFKEEANGSIIEVDGKKYGSELLGQQFTDNKYLWGRIMNINTETFTNKDGMATVYAGPSNKTPAGEEFEAQIHKDNESFYWGMTMTYGFMYYQNEIKWANWCIDKLKEKIG